MSHGETRIRHCVGRIVVCIDMEEHIHYCNICCKTLRSSHTDYSIQYHISHHTTGMILEGEIYYIMPKTNRIVEYGVVVVMDVMPQIIYVCPVDIDDFINKLICMLDEVKETIKTLRYSEFGSFNSIFREPQLFDSRMQIMELIHNTQFNCPFIVSENPVVTCDIQYEHGLPSMEMTEKHISTCHFSSKAEKQNEVHI